MAKALFLVLHRKDRSPGQRYRHEQYLSFLEESGIECTFSPLLDEKGDLIFYNHGNVFSKISIGLKALLRRLKDLRRANQFDFIYIYRDAFFFGTFFEKRLAKKKVKIIYDYDDAIWLMAQIGKLIVTDLNATRFGISVRRAIDFLMEKISGMQGGEIFTPVMRAFKVGDLAKVIAPDSELEVVGLRAGDKLHEVILTESGEKVYSNQVDLMNEQEIDLALRDQCI